VTSSSISVGDSKINHDREEILLIHVSCKSLFLTKYVAGEYYTAVQRYDFYLRVVKTIFYERAQRVSKILFLTGEDKSYIFEPQFNSVYSLVKIWKYLTVYFQYIMKLIYLRKFEETFSYKYFTNIFVKTNPKLCTAFWHSRPCCIR
jgi:hypothetical protein